MAWQEPRVVTLALSVLALVNGLFLLLGYLTSAVCLAGVLLCVLSALFFPAPVLNGTAFRIASAFTAIITFSLFCLGPGAYSLDARRHGRREIIIPSRNRT
jgi:uncharacterized membrane protein YphA (DoxX/SURF4 family)